MYLTKAHEDELISLSDSLKRNLGGTVTAEVSDAVCDALMGIHLDYNLDLLRTQNNLHSKTRWEWDRVVDCVDIVRVVTGVEAHTFLSHDHVEAFRTIHDKWTQTTFFMPQDGLSERDAICAFAFEDLSRVPAILHVMSSRRMYKADDVVSVVRVMDSSQVSELKDGAL